MALHLATLLSAKGIVADCNVCQALGYSPVRKAKFDLPLAHGGFGGTWGYACHTHAHEYGRKV